MTELSSNWKKLRGKVQKSKTSKTALTKVTKKKIVKETETKITKPTGVIIPRIVQDEIKQEQPQQLSQLANILLADVIVLAPETPQEPKLTPKKKSPGKYLAIDCEFVGVGPEGTESALARVSIVNFYGYTIYDKFVKPREKVTDWRTWVSGVTPKHMKDAITFKQAQQETADLFKDKILVGHALHHDLDALFLSHPKSMIRDTTTFKPFRAISNGKTPGLKKLTSHFLKIDIQEGQHSSVEDARATMLLFRMYKKEFEKGLKRA